MQHVLSYRSVIMLLAAVLCIFQWCMNCNGSGIVFGLVFFAEISKKISAVRWFNKTEDCIFPRSFIHDPLYNLSISRSDLRLQYCSYLSIFSGSTHPFAYIRDFPRSLFCILQVHCTIRLMQLNVCHTLYS